MGLDPDVAYQMTPRQISRVTEGYQQKERAAWERTLRISGHLGDKLTAEKLFSGGGQMSMTEDRYSDLKERMGYTNDTR